MAEKEGKGLSVKEVLEMTKNELVFLV